MISKEDFEFISRFDGQDPKAREALIKANPMQLPKTFFNLLNQISKDQTIQYLLTLMDDILQVQLKIAEYFCTHRVQQCSNLGGQGPC